MWFWLHPQDWPNVSGELDMVEKALWVVRETLEKLSARVVAGRVFLRALPAVMETALHDVAKS